jgi:hypothetical protein
MEPHLDSNNIRTTTITSNAPTIIKVKESHSQGSHSSLSCDAMSLDLLQKQYDDMRQQLSESHKEIDELKKSLEVRVLTTRLTCQ